MTIEAERGYAKGRATRRRIVEEAMALFGEVGYRSASLREIAARCGMSHPGLLHHFASKELLLGAVLEHRDVVDAERFALEEGTGPQRLQQFVALVAHNAGVPGIVELYATLAAEASAADHPAHDYFVARYQRLRERLTETFRAVQEEGRLRPGLDPAHLAVATIALTDGLQVQWLLDRGSVDMAAALGRFLDAVVDRPNSGDQPVAQR
jgi:AcrR family transcriptional regulator